MQKKKNIRLLLVLIGLSIVTTIVAMFDGSNTLDVERNLFVVANTNVIDKVEVSFGDETNTLTLVNRQWHLNKKHTANLARINDLFIILNEVSVRRKAGKTEQEELKKKLLNDGAKVQLHSNDQLLETYYYGSNEKKSLTYQMRKGQEVYIVNIPGHNYHIASLFELSAEDWRTAYVFASNWTTFDRMEVTYPESSDKQKFSINYDRTGYFVPTVENLDSAKMYEYLEQVSYLQVVNYLDKPLLPEGAKSLATIAIFDIDANVASIEFFPFDDSRVIGKISEVEWASFRLKDLERLLISPIDFELTE